MKSEKQIKKIVKDLKIKENIKLVILFGSQARGDYDDNSDVDIAILFDELFLLNINSLELRNELSILFSTNLKTEADLVLLNKAGSLLKYQIIKYGKPLYISDDFSYNTFFSSVLKEYFDFQYYQNLHNKLLIKRFKG